MSLGVVHARPGIESIFGGNTNPVSDGIIALTHQSRSIICNGHNILALSREDIVNMSLSDAHETLFQLRVEGNLMKKGFKRLRMWKLRYFTYLEKSCLTGKSVLPYGFHVGGESQQASSPSRDHIGLCYFNGKLAWTTLFVYRST